MEPYANVHGNSGIAAYGIGSDSITVEFKRGGTYVYTYSSAGAGNIEEMKSLAHQGYGLNGFINTEVRFDYADKF